MDKSGVLYTYEGNYRALQALITAAYSGVNVTVDPSFQFGVTNKSDAFLNKFPLGKVPAYQSKDGNIFLTETNAISYFVADQAIKGGNCQVEQAKVVQWLSFAQTELHPAICGWLFPSMSIMQYNKDQVAKAKSEVERCLKYLDKILLPRTYLVGESVTLADIAVFATLVDLFNDLLDESSRKQYVNVCRWFDTVLNQRKVSEAMKKYSYRFSYCATPIKFDPKKFAEITGSTSAPKKDNKKKEEKPKAEKKKPQPKEEEMDAAEEAMAAEPKSKDPFEAFPKGSFNMDDFKRCYSNKDTVESVPYFWEKFDPENYSIWFGEYKYNDELTKIFMSSNLIGGMFQRLDKLRKNAFASVCLFGEDNNSSISGIWIWRGHELAFTLSPDWQVDYECYSWKKLDPKSPETKKMVDEYLHWEVSDNKGRKFNQGKIFK